jgi:ArsR family transcriptional regulator, cadmium/lead-responsive transcriptional repressor
MPMIEETPAGDEREAADAGVPAAAVLLFRTLGDPARLRILQHLTLGEHRVVDLTEHLGLAQSTVSQHLASLRDCGLVVSRPQGRSSVFSLTAQAQLSSLLTASERLLAATGHGVALWAAAGESEQA